MEEENKVIVKAEIPGVNKEDIEVSVDDGILRIKAEKKEEKKEKGLSEFIYGKFERQVKLPEVNAENINAEYKDGILKLEIPKEEKIVNYNIGLFYFLRIVNLAIHNKFNITIF